MSKYTTRQRRLLLEYLQTHADETLSAKQIAADIAQSGVSISAVYRNLAVLEEENKITRISKGGSRTVYYRYTDADACKKHLHLSCFKCGKTYHMDIPATNTLIENVAKETKFQVDSAGTVLYGVCETCQKV